MFLKSFPDGGCNGWTISEFGPLYIPAKGSVVGMKSGNTVAVSERDRVGTEKETDIAWRFGSAGGTV